jgi:hypothetical protein
VDQVRFRHGLNPLSHLTRSNKQPLRPPSLEPGGALTFTRSGRLLVQNPVRPPSLEPGGALTFTRSGRLLVQNPVRPPSLEPGGAPRLGRTLISRTTALGSPPQRPAHHRGSRRP